MDVLGSVTEWGIHALHLARVILSAPAQTIDALVCSALSGVLAAAWAEIRRESLVDANYALQERIATVEQKLRASSAEVLEAELHSRLNRMVWQWQDDFAFKVKNEYEGYRLRLDEVVEQAELALERARDVHDALDELLRQTTNGGGAHGVDEDVEKIKSTLRNRLPRIERPEGEQ